MRRRDAAQYERKRADILQAAGACFARDGFQRTTIADICAEAGVGSGNLYHYFASKEAIIAALAAATLQQATQALSVIAASPRPMAAMIERIELGLITEAQKRSRMLIEVLAEAFRNPEVALPLQKHTDGLRLLLSDLISKSQASGESDPSLNPKVAAAVLLSALDGAGTMFLRSPDLDRTQAAKLFGEMIRRFLGLESDL